MRRRLPCSRCSDGASLKTPAGVIPYEIGGVTPSAFKTLGQDFVYRCQKCDGRNKLTKMGFFALPDLDPKPVEPVPEVVASKPVVKKRAKKKG